MRVYSLIIMSICSSLLMLDALFYIIYELFNKCVLISTDNKTPKTSHSQKPSLVDQTLRQLFADRQQSFDASEQEIFVGNPQFCEQEVGLVKIQSKALLKIPQKIMMK